MSITNRFSLKRPLGSYAKVQRWVSWLVRNRTFQIRRGVLDKQYLDIGCGPNTDASFINLDYSWRPDIDLCWDVTRGLPLATNSLLGIYSEHCFEHLPYAAMEPLLAECYRVLRPGGVLRIVVPDGELYLRGYAEASSGRQLPYAEFEGVDGIYSPIISVNRVFRDHGHLFIYDFDLFSKLLNRQGFVQIQRTTFGVGRDPKLLRDTASRELESLYLEASKP